MIHPKYFFYLCAALTLIFLTWQGIFIIGMLTLAYLCVKLCGEWMYNKVVNLFK